MWDCEIPCYQGPRRLPVLLPTEGDPRQAVDALPGPEAVDGGREVTEVSVTQRLLQCCHKLFKLFE